MHRFHDNNTRRHPRTLAEAFPWEQQVIEHHVQYHHSLLTRVLDAIGWAVAIVGLLSIIYAPRAWGWLL